VELSENILETQSGVATNQQIASSSNGQKIAVVWSSSSVTNTPIKVTLSADGGGTWSTPATLSDTGLTAQTPQVFSSDDGSVLAVAWRTRNTSTGVYKIAVTTSTDSGQTWSTLVNLNSFDSDQPPLGITIEGSTDGDYITLAWRYYNSNSYAYMVQAASTQNSGTSWSATKTFSSPLVTSTGFNSSLAVSSDGLDVAIAWAGIISSQHYLKYADSSDGGVTWNTPVTLVQTTDVLRAYKVGISSDGSVRAVSFTQRPGNNSEERVNVIVSQNSGTNWDSQIAISAPSAFALSPILNISDNGENIKVTWQNYSTGSPYIVSSSLSTDEGDNWSSASALFQTNHAINKFDLASSSDNYRTTALWGNNIEYSTNVGYGSSWSTPVSISNHNGIRIDPEIVATNSGNKFFAVWRQRVSSGIFRVYFSILSVPLSDMESLVDLHVDDPFAEPLKFLASKVKTETVQSKKDDFVQAFNNVLDAAELSEKVDETDVITIKEAILLL
jgi:hypothetical protein